MSKREELREKKHRQQQRQRSIMIVGIAVVAIGFAAFLIIPGIVANSKPVGAIVTVTPLPYPNPQKSSIGDPNAPVKVIEYSDFQCPYCKQFEDDHMASLVSGLIATGKVYFTYLPWQIIPGTESNSAAEAAMCAADQNKFWEYHDILFANQGAENSGQYTDKRLKAYAEAVGLDMNKFNSCYSNQSFKNLLAQYQAQGVQQGVSGTPSFSINGKLIEYQNQQDIIDAINAAVQGK
ncbi:MAG: thioredoxin domain-containing protein [Anaerolineaceae bacterium]|nr:thioredoxin domain-containing protein [Anaerolineaceae bacterium]